MNRTHYDHVVIEISDDEKEHPMYDSTNFFLPIVGSQSEKIEELEQRLKNYEKEMDKLKTLNSECLSKIRGYECKSILDLNRKLRSGIPVPFYPSHTMTTLHTHDDIDLH